MNQNIRWIDFLPIALFSYGTRLAGLTASQGSWNYAFYIGAGLALLQMLYTWYRDLRIDYIALGANLFLIYGALGYVIHKALIAPYDIFQESVVFLWIFIVGLITTIALPDGFIQLPQENKKSSTVGSLTLLGTTGISLLISYCLATYTNLNGGFVVTLPFVGLLLARETLRNYFIKRS